MSVLYMIQGCNEEYRLFKPKNNEEKYEFHIRRMKCTRCLIRRRYIYARNDLFIQKEIIEQFTEAWDSLVADTNLKDKLDIHKLYECIAIYKKLWKAYFAGNIVIEKEKLELELPYCSDERYLCEAYTNE